MSKDRIDFGTLNGKELVAALMGKFNAHLDRMKATGRHDRMVRSVLKYYASDGGDDTRVMSGGRRGELTVLRPNKYRGTLQRILNLNSGQMPSWDVRAVNTDAKSSRQTRLGDNLIEYYGTSEKLWERFLERDEVAFTNGEVWIAAPWDRSRGVIHTYRSEPKLDASGKQSVGADGEPETTEQPVYTGDFRFLVLSPWDCCTESFSEDRDKPTWSIFRYFVNRYDLAALYPAQSEAILRAKSWAETRKDLEFLPAGKDEDDDAVAVYEWHRVRSPSMPRGRQCRFIDAEILGEPGPLEYKGLPLFRTSPGDVLFVDGSGGGGWTPAFDLLAPCEAHSNQVTTILSNHAALGVQCFKKRRGANVNMAQVGPLSVVELDDPNDLEAINFTHTPAEVFTFLEVLVGLIDDVSGLNAAARGDAEALKGDSGSKSALVLSAAQQMQNRFQRSRTLADSMLLTHVIDTLKTHATVERVIQIGGKANTYAAQTFKGEELDGVSNVVVHPGNPLKDTADGRMQLAEAFMKMGGIKDADQLYQVLTTGNLDHIDESQTAEQDLIHQENEILSDPTDTRDVPVLPTDQHHKHLLCHPDVMKNPALRDPSKPENARILERLMKHQMAHVNALRTLDPDFLRAMGEEPMGQMQATDTTTPGQGGAPTSTGAPSSGDASTTTTGPSSPDGLPNMPSGPKDPSTGEQVPVQVPQLQQMTT